MKKIALDIIGIIGIIIVIIGGVFVYYEAESCRNPLQTIVHQVLANQNITDFKYTYVTLNFYTKDSDFPLKKYKLDYDGNQVMEIIYLNYSIPIFNQTKLEKIK